MNARVKWQLIVALSLMFGLGSVGIIVEPAGADVCDDFARLSGAIFTTDQNGEPVNMNIYNNKKFVYLDGGPGPGAPISAAALPAGDYYFQVTNPSGRVLLSTDSIEARRFTVSEFGVIVSAIHHTEDDADYGGDPYYAKVVQLMPFDDTPNPGGVYKVWVTPVDCYDITEKAGCHGFIPRYSKTDNFKVKGEIDQYLCIQKFKDCDGDGVWDQPNPETGEPGEPELVWSVDIAEPRDEQGNAIVRPDISVPDCILAWDGEWTVTESLPFNGCYGWEVTALIIDDESQAPSIEASVVFDGSDLKRNGTETHTVIFGNRPLSSIKVLKFEDCDLDSEKDTGEAVIAGITFALEDENREPVLDELGKPVEVTTDSNGEAAFCGLPAGIYWVVEVLTAEQAQEWLPSEPIMVTIELCAGPAEIEVEVPNIPLGCVVACKFYDRNINGAWDKDEPLLEPGVEGFEMELWMGDPKTSGVLLGTDKTGSDGCVSFCGLLPGWYTVREIMPPELGNCPWVAITPTSVAVQVVPCEADPKATFGNVVTGLADFDTKGYWQNKNGLSELEEADRLRVNALAPYASPSDYFGAGDEPFDGMWYPESPSEPVDVAAAFSGDEEIWAAGTWQSEVSAFLTDNNGNASLNDHKEQLAQQLLAFIFNVQHRLGGSAAISVGGAWESTDSIIDDAVDIWLGSDDAAIVAMTDKLDALNNNDAVEYILNGPGSCAPPSYE